MPRHEIPSVPGILSTVDVKRTAESIARAQEPSGALPWFPGGHTDPWDHVESAMALSAAGRFAEAEAAYEWSRSTQRPDGSWPLKTVAGRVEDPAADSNFCAYLAVGVWHHALITGDTGFATRMWPTVRRAIDFVLGLQTARGEICWVRSPTGEFFPVALLSGCSSIHHSLRCALLLAETVGESQPDWAVALGALGHVITHHPEAFLPKSRYSMDWYYPILGGALRGTDAKEHLDAAWSDFVVDGLGIRCVNDHPWVTGAETCELALALDAIGEYEQARELFAAMQHLRDPDGSYWTGLVYTDGKHWPVERTTWTGASVVLAADALSRTTPGNGIFRAAPAPAGLAAEIGDCGCRSNAFAATASTSVG